MNRSTLEATFDIGIKAWKLAQPQIEFRFHPSRKWRFDRAWPELSVAVEIDGGTWTQGRHVSPVGYAEDCDKLNAAALLGWTVLRFTGEHVRQGQAFAVVAEALRVAQDRLQSRVDATRN